MAYISFQPSDYFNTLLYTGDGASSKAITGVGFQPDWVWIKNRADAEAHSLYDAVRGTQKPIYSNLTNAQATETNGLSSFDSDGFTVGSSGAINGSSDGMVSWNWKANGQGSSNTDGSINTTYTSANTTSGFSIVKYTGTGSNATIGHGLGVAPSMVIVKKTSATGDWMIYHKSLGATKYIFLQSTDASGTQTSIWNDTEPTTTVFTVGTSTTVNQSGQDYIAYCFSQKSGFSSMGSYVGNGSTDGSFIYTGMSPAIIIAKKTSGTGDWFINDIKRNTFNVVNSQLYPNLNDPEENVNATQLDILSNGFKLKGTTSNALNSGNDTYIYLAFAESSIVSSNGVPATAR